MKSAAMMVPGFHMAAELPLRDWLFVRGGMQYAFASGNSSTGNGAATADATTGVFGWTAGVGLRKGRFDFDGSLQHGCVLLNCQAGLLSMASATYRFGDAKGVITLPEAAPAPSAVVTLTRVAKIAMIAMTVAGIAAAAKFNKACG